MHGANMKIIKSYFILQRVNGQTGNSTVLSLLSEQIYIFFNVLLTVHLSIFILVINQLNAQILVLYIIRFIICLHMFRALCAHHQEVKIVLYSIWYHHTCRWPSGARDGHLQVWWSRSCIIQFWPPDDEHMVLETCRGMK